VFSSWLSECLGKLQHENSWHSCQEPDEKHAYRMSYLEIHTLKFKQQQAQECTEGPDKECDNFFAWINYVYSTCVE
jgi:hypothetical protein